jgi:CubicO group peptidase (beta-lactamase class C family)
LGPAGLSLYSTAPDLAAYAKAHLEGTALLSRKSAELMRTPHAALPENATWGLGWKLINGEKTTFVGHDGGTIGQVASLWTSPVHGLAIAMCANGGLANRAWDHVAYPIFREVCGDVPELRPPPAAPAPRALLLYEGDYDNLGVTMYVRAKDDHLAVRAKIKSYAASDIHLELSSVGDDKFRTTIGGDDKVIMQFLDPDKKGRPQLFYAGRLHKRKAGPV